MALSISTTALSTTYLGNKQLNETIPVLPDNETIPVPSNDTIPIPDPTPTPTPIPVDPTPTTPTYKLNNMQLGLVIGGGIVGFGVLVALLLWSVSLCKAHNNAIS